MDGRILESPDYGKSLLIGLQELYTHQQLCDFSLVANDIEIQIHSTVLFSASKFFRGLIQHGGGLVQTSYQLETADIETVKLLVNFLYTGCLVLTQDNVWPISAIASQLDISEAVELCQKYINEEYKSDFQAGVSFDNITYVSLTPEDVQNINSDSIQQGPEQVNSVGLLQQVAQLTGVSLSCVTTSNPSEKIKQDANILVKSHVKEEAPYELPCNSTDDLNGGGSLIPCSVNDGANKPHQYGDSQDNKPTEQIKSSPKFSIESSYNSSVECTPTVKRKRGRPRKHVTPSIAPVNNVQPSQKKRGRPRKIPQNISPVQTIHSKQCDEHLSKPHLDSELANPAERTEPPVRDDVNCLYYARPLRTCRSQTDAIKPELVSILKINKHLNQEDTKLENPIQKPHSKSAKVFQVKSGEKKYQCLECGSKFSWYSLLSAHQRLHYIKSSHSVYSKYIYLKAIPFTFKTSSTLNGEYQCPICNKLFSTSSYLKAHTMKKHPQKYFKTKSCCFYCKPLAKLKNSKILYLHKLELHKDRMDTSQLRVKHAKCEICERQYLHQVNLLRHVRRSHPLFRGNAGREFKRRLTKEVKARTLVTDLVTKCQQQMKFICDACGLLYSSRSSLSNHKVRRHGMESRYICGTCNKRFVNKVEYADHVDGHARIKKHECNQCGKFFTHKTTLIAHSKICYSQKVDPAKLKPFECATCHVRYTHLTGLTKHIETVHNNLPTKRVRVKTEKNKEEPAELYSCAWYNCKETFPDSHLRKDHLDQVHLAKFISCQVCGLNCKSKIGLKDHMKMVHPDIKPEPDTLICALCGILITAHHMKFHLRTHGPKNFQCDQCSYATTGRKALRVHMYDVHRTKMYENMVTHSCARCPFTTALHTRFVDHMGRHGDEKKFSCKHCGKTFKTRAGVRGHVRIAHREKKFHCEYCNFSAPMLCKLEDHTRVMHTHRNVKPYKCSYCNFQCATSGNIHVHLKRMHKGLPLLFTKLDPNSPEAICN